MLYESHRNYTVIENIRDIKYNGRRPLYPKRCSEFHFPRNNLPCWEGAWSLARSFDSKEFTEESTVANVARIVRGTYTDHVSCIGPSGALITFVQKACVFFVSCPVPVARPSVRFRDRAPIAEVAASVEVSTDAGARRKGGEKRQKFPVTFPPTHEQPHKGNGRCGGRRGKGSGMSTSDGINRDFLLFTI